MAGLSGMLLNDRWGSEVDCSRRKGISMAKSDDESWFEGEWKECLLEGEKYRCCRECLQSGRWGYYRRVLPFGMMAVGCVRKVLEQKPS